MALPKNQKVYGADKKKTPLNLQYLIKDNLSDEEIFNSPGEFSNEKQLLWWSYDLRSGRKKSDLAKALEKQKKLAKNSDEEKRALEEKNRLYLEKLKKKYLETEEQLKLRKVTFEQKQKELLNLKRINELKFEKDIIDLEEEFQKESKEHAEAMLFIEEEKKLLAQETELNILTEQNAQSLEAKANLQEKARKKMDTELFGAVKEEENGGELLKKAKLSLKEKAEKQLKERENEIKKLESKKSELMSKTQAVIYDGDFLPRANQYEAYNAENVIEIKDLSLRHKQTGEKIISDFTMDLKFNSAVTLFSDSSKKLLLIFEAINRTFSNEYIISKGEIRIDGVVTTSLKRQDFKTRFSGTILSINEVFHILQSLRKTINNAVKHFAADKDTVYNYLKLMDEDVYKNKTLNKKISSLSVDFIFKLALSVSLSFGLPLLFLSFYDMPISEQATIKVIQFINTVKRESALMMFSTDKKMLLKIKDAVIYNLK